jgi:hypothetical protein
MLGQTLETRISLSGEPETKSVLEWLKLDGRSISAVGRALVNADLEPEREEARRNAE